LTLNELHGIISQKMVLFITTAVRTSNPILCKYGLFLNTTEIRVCLQKYCTDIYSGMPV
jgi:hypothetical protein